MGKSFKNNSPVLKKFCTSLLLLAGVHSISLAAHADTTNTTAPKLYENAAKLELSTSMLSNKKLDGVLRIPAQIAYGYSGKAATPEQHATADTVADKLKQNISKLIALDPSLGCTYKVTDIDKFDSEKASYEEKGDGAHSKITTEYLVLKADFTIACKKSVIKQNVKVDFSEHFKTIDKFLVEVNGKEKRKFQIEKSSGNFTL